MLNLYNKLNNTKYTIDKLFIEMIDDNNIEMVKVCLKHGADVHADDDRALRWAAHYGYTEIVKLLLDHGADINKFTSEQREKYG